MDNTNFKIGPLRHMVGEDELWTEKNTYAGSGLWLGSEFFKSIGKQFFPV